MLRDERGVAAVEYALMVALISIVIVAVSFVGHAANNKFQRVGSSLGTTTSVSSPSASPSPVGNGNGNGNNGNGNGNGNGGGNGNGK